MKNKIKAVLSLAIVALMMFPAAASLAAFGIPQGTNLPGGTITGIISNLMQWILMIIGFLGVIGFAISGVLYLTSAGDEGRIGQAKQAMLMSIVGVIVAIIGVVVMQAAKALLEGTNTSF